LIQTTRLKPSTFFSLKVDISLIIPLAFVYISNVVLNDSHIFSSFSSFDQAAINCFKHAWLFV